MQRIRGLIPSRPTWLPKIFNRAPKVSAEDIELNRIEDIRRQSEALIDIPRGSMSYFHRVAQTLAAQTLTASSNEVIGGVQGVDQLLGALNGNINGIIKSASDGLDTNSEGLSKMESEALFRLVYFKHYLSSIRTSVMEKEILESALDINRLVSVALLGSSSERISGSSNILCSIRT
jgi:hypothetical protein